MKSLGRGSFCGGTERNHDEYVHRKVDQRVADLTACGAAVLRAAPRRSSGLEWQQTIVQPDRGSIPTFRLSSMPSTQVSAQNRRRAFKVVQEALETVAANQGTITYSALAAQLPPGARYRPNSRALSELLCQISLRSDAQGRGLLSAVVVRQDSGRPGNGFYGIAATRRGRDVSDEVQCWQGALEEVHRAARARSVLALRCAIGLTARPISARSI